MRTIAIASLLIVIAGPVGCVTVGGTREGNPIDAARVAEIKVGETTKAEITRWFGAPFRIEQSDITGMAQSALSRFVGDQLTLKLDPALYNDVFLYQRRYASWFSLFFIVFNYFSSDTRFDRLAVVFDEHDKVAAVGWSEHDWRR